MQRREITTLQDVFNKSKNVNHLRSSVRQQEYNLLMLVHPFYNLLVEPYWIHDEDAQHMFRKRLISQIFRYQDDPKNERTNLVNLILNIPNVLSDTNESHKDYYQRLCRFLHNTRMGTLGIVEERGNIELSALLLNALGYRNNLFVIPSQESDPEPDRGFTYRHVAQALLWLGVDRLVVGGQNSWISTSNKDGVNQHGPFIITPTDQPLPSDLYALSGCVGGFIQDVTKEFSHLPPAKKKKSPQVQISQLTWPQRRSTDRRV